MKEAVEIFFLEYTEVFAVDDWTKDTCNAVSIADTSQHLRYMQPCALKPAFEEWKILKIFYQSSGKRAVPPNFRICNTVLSE